MKKSQQIQSRRRSASQKKSGHRRQVRDTQFRALYASIASAIRRGSTRYTSRGFTCLFKSLNPSKDELSRYGFYRLIRLSKTIRGYR